MENRLAKDRIIDKYTRRQQLKTLIIFLIISSVFTYIISFGGFGEFKITVFVILTSIIIVPAIIFYAVLFNSKITFTGNDKDTLIIALNFLNYTETDKTSLYSKLETLFSAHPKDELHKLIKKFENTPITYSAKKISTKEPVIRYYAIYSLMDLASVDGVYSLKEEEYIENVCRLLKIHSLTFQTIKNAYLKKGLQEERKILEEQSRKAFETDFVPFNAYHVLGITPAITIGQLKDVYRDLAKKYHPDHFIGQSEAQIHEAEEKFNEITLAYKIILKHLKT